MKLARHIPVEGVPARASARLWRHRAQTRLTVAIELGLSFRSGACVVEAQAPTYEETDFALRSPSAGVVLEGCARALGRTAKTEVVTRLVVSSRGSMWVDKSVTVVGDLDRAGGRRAFATMPLVWDRAVGGRHFPDNPIGTSYGANLIDPRDPSRPACFAPLARGWGARTRLLGATTLASLSADLPDLPEAFDFSYFQRAPNDQRAPSWRGGERIVLYGMSHDHPDVAMELPAYRACFRVDDDGRKTSWVEAPCDLIAIDADRMSATCVFRADVPVGTIDNLEVEARLTSDVAGTLRPMFAEEETMAATSLPQPPTATDAPNRRTTDPPASAEPSSAPKIERSKSGTLMSPRRRRSRT